LATFSTALDLAALARLAVFASVAAADASWLGAVTRAEAFLLFFILVTPSALTLRASARFSIIVSPERAPSLDDLLRAVTQNKAVHNAAQSPALAFGSRPSAGIVKLPI
jgi:hypothetical protein